MIKSILLYGSLFVSLLLCATLFQLPVIDSLQLNAVVWCLVMIGMLRGARAGLVAGILIGLVQDISFGTFLGESAFAYALVGYVAGSARSLVIRDSLPLAILLTGICTELFDWITFVTGRFFGEAVIMLHAAVQESSRSALSTMVLCVVLYYPFYRAFVRKPRVRYDDESIEA